MSEQPKPDGAAPSAASPSGGASTEPKPEAGAQAGSLDAAAAAVRELRERVAADAGGERGGERAPAPKAGSEGAPAPKAGSEGAPAPKAGSEGAPAPKAVAKEVAASPLAAAPPVRAVASRAAAVEEDLDDDELAAELGGGRRWGRWAVLVMVAAVVIGGGVTVLVGRANAQRFVMRCAPEAIVAERGRAFPPWGVRALEGKPWRPIPLPLSAECRDRAASSEEELSGYYLQALMEHAGAKLSSRKPDDVEPAASLLEQAALLARSPERRAERDVLGRLWGDVEYGRAVAKLAAARDALAGAAKQLEPPAG